jgi:hypothetical protein
LAPTNAADTKIHMIEPMIKFVMKTCRDLSVPKLLTWVANDSSAEENKKRKMPAIGSEITTPSKTRKITLLFFSLIGLNNPLNGCAIKTKASAKTVVSTSLILVKSNNLSFSGFDK